jgi:hypothetical protein
MKSDSPSLYIRMTIGLIFLVYSHVSQFYIMLFGGKRYEPLVMIIAMHEEVFYINKKETFKRLDVIKHVMWASYACPFYHDI